MEKENQENKFPTVYKIEQAEVPIQKAIVSKKENVNWVLNGVNHSYPLFLANLSSPMHSASVETKSQMYAGEGIQIDESNLNKQEIENWFKQINVSQTIKYLSKDIATFGYGFLQIQYSKAKQVVGINHIDATTVAVSKTNDKFYVSDNWAECERKEEYYPKEYPSFNPDNIKAGSQILMVKPYYSPNSIYYPKPDYSSGIDYIALESDIVNFWNNYLNRGMFPSVMMTFLRGRNNSDKNIENKFIQRLNEVYSGKDRQHTLVNFVDDMSEKPDINSFQISDIDKQFTILKDILSENICTAHRITNKGLFGIATAGSLGQRTELIEAYEILLNNVIYPVQIVIENSIKQIIAINYGEVELSILDSNPISFQFDSASLVNILTKDELRAKIGYEPITDNNSSQPSLAEVIGVGGMQSLTAILTSPLTEEQKLGILVNAFNLELEKAKEMIYGLNVNPAPTPTIPTTLNELFKNKN